MSLSEIGQNFELCLIVAVQENVQKFQTKLKQTELINFLKCVLIKTCNDFQL